MRRISLTLLLGLTSWLYPALVIPRISVEAVGADNLLALLSQPGSNDASDQIAQVNALRATYGLAPFISNSVLMASAQTHREYQASIETFTHAGADGSDEAQPAIAAGYGDGAAVLCDEDVGWGVNLTPQGAVYLWQDAPHLAIMTSKVFKDAGAGVAANAENHVFYTLDACYAGNPGSGSSAAGSDLLPTSLETVSPVPTMPPILPIVTSTPRPDGAIIHVVQPGQTIISIAAAYGVKEQDLLAYNGLTEQSVIFPGDFLIIRLPATPGSTQEETPTITQAPEESPSPSPMAATGTPTPTRTQLPPTITIQATGVLVAAGTKALIQPAATRKSGPDYLLIAILLLGASGGIFIVLGNALKRAP
jgi:LysM repeat protein